MMTSKRKPREGCTFMSILYMWSLSDHDWNNVVEIFQMVLSCLKELIFITDYFVVTASTITTLQAFIVFYFSPTFTYTSRYDLNMPILHKFKSSSWLKERDPHCNISGVVLIQLNNGSKGGIQKKSHVAEIGSRMDDAFKQKFHVPLLFYNRVQEDQQHRSPYLIKNVTGYTLRSSMS